MGANLEYFTCSECGAGITCDEYAAEGYKRKERSGHKILCDRCQKKEDERYAY